MNMSSDESTESDWIFKVRSGFIPGKVSPERQAIGPAFKNSQGQVSQRADRQSKSSQALNLFGSIEVGNKFVVGFFR